MILYKVASPGIEEIYIENQIIVHEAIMTDSLEAKDEKTESRSTQSLPNINGLKSNGLGMNKWLRD